MLINAHNFVCNFIRSTKQSIILINNYINNIILSLKINTTLYKIIL